MEDHTETHTQTDKDTEREKVTQNKVLPDLIIAVSGKQCLTKSHL